MKAVANAIIVLILIGIVVVSAFLLYMWSSKEISMVTPAVESVGVMKIEGVRAGIGFIDLFVRSISISTNVDTLYLIDCTTSNIYTAIKLPKRIAVHPGEAILVHVPLVGLGIDLESLPREACVALGTAAGISLESLQPLPLGDYLKEASVKATIALIACRGVSCTVGDRNVDPNNIHWVYINLVTGGYRLKYIAGSDEREATGKATFIRDSNTLDLSSMSWEERYALGPVVIFINPYYASKDYTIRVIDIHGGEKVYTLRKLVDGPDKVSLDIVALWEDLWWPGTTSDLDNYVDHVVRLTIFVNNTARIEVLHASGCYLHMFALNPPSFDAIQDIVKQYQDNGFRLPQGSGIIYVKTHGAEVPPLDKEDLWDPVNGKWVESWPPVFYR